MKQNSDSGESVKLYPKDHCFIIMAYNPSDVYDVVYRQLQEMIEGEFPISCIRADRALNPGQILLEKVHEQILGADVVVADVTEHNPNVYYEYGYASAHNRLPVLIAKEGAKLPTDLVGKELLRYRGTPGEDPDFKGRLLNCIIKRLTSPLPEQRRMLSSPRPFPAYVIAAPRTPGDDSKHWWHPDEKQTFGDMFGIVGILTAYGNLFGTRILPDLLHARYLTEDFLDRAATFFCIGSSKVNPATRHFLPRIQRGLAPSWRLIEEGNKDDKRIYFSGEPSLDGMLSRPMAQGEGKSATDYGLVIRAPHPEHSDHMVLILAGRHSIGTHAACMVVTQQKLIASLEMKLGKDVSLRETRKPFWAVVSGALGQDGLLSDEVEIIKAGTYEHSSEK